MQWIAVQKYNLKLNAIMKNRLSTKLEKQMGKYRNKYLQNEFIAIKQLKILNSVNGQTDRHQ